MGHMKSGSFFDNISLFIPHQVATQLLFLYLRRCTSITDQGIKLVSSYCYQVII